MTVTNKERDEELARLVKRYAEKKIFAFHFEGKEYNHVGEDESGNWLYRPVGSWV